VKKLLVGAAVFLLVSCGGDDDKPADADDNKLPSTRVEIITDWYDDQDDDLSTYTREVRVNGRACIQFHSGYWGEGGGGIDCDWSPR
jgi:hypothetical protein